MLMNKTPLLRGSAQAYDQAFFLRIRQDALQSAEVVVPILIKLVHPYSVVDVGCGTGTWLSVFKKFGINKILGIDGDYIERSSLQIDPEEFSPNDLSQPFSLPQTFDLALCLEVAEHIPAIYAQNLVDSLTGLSPMIFFSAAIPGQYGLHHINTQWPEYWEKLFTDSDYLMLDPIRPLIWQDQRVAWYYRQNCFLFARKSVVEGNDDLSKLAEIHAHNDMLLISKNMFAAHLSLTYSLKRTPGLIISILMRTYNKIFGFR